jgi:hypothetical protein
MHPTSSSHVSSSAANTAVAGAIALAIGAVYLKSIESSASPKTSKLPGSATTAKMREVPAEENLLGSIEQLPDDLKDRIFSHLLPLLPVHKVVTLRNMAMQSSENRWAQNTIDTFFTQVLALPHQDRPTLKQFQDFLHLEQQIKAHRAEIHTLIDTLKTERGEPSRQWNFYLGIIPYTKSIHPAHTVKASFISALTENAWKLEHQLQSNIHAFNAQLAPDVPPIDMKSLKVIMEKPEWQSSVHQASHPQSRYLVGFDTNKLGDAATHVQPEIEVSEYIDSLEKHLYQFERMPFISSNGINQTIFQFGAQSLSEMMHTS